MASSSRRRALALAALVVALPAAAQEGGARIGIGVGLPTSEITNLVAGLVTPAYLYVPIDVTPQIRIEPQVGVLTANQDGGDKLTAYSVGAGIFLLVPAGQQAHLYVGPRVAYMHETQKNRIGLNTFTEEKGTNWWIAAALGGEVMAHPRIGVGGEAQLGYTKVGDRDETTNGVASGTTPGGSSVQTQGVIFVRVYF